RSLPSVDQTLRDPSIARLLEEAPRRVVVDAVRSAIARARESGARDSGSTAPEELAAAVEQAVRQWLLPSRRRAINATGIILHTGLGRAPLARQAVEAVSREASGYCLLEIDADSGERGARDAHVRDLLRRLSGAEDATVVNNNAA